MATRSGTVDPGLVLWLANHEGVDPAEISEALEHRSGLLGLAGTADMRAVLDGYQAGEPDARLALEVYLHRLRASVASMVASLGGIDAIAFTGGVGERAPAVRAMAADGLGFLGVAVDAAANNRPGTGDREIGAPGGAVQTFVIPAREDVEIARDVRRVVGPSG
jgi:acetate kinase